MANIRNTSSYVKFVKGTSEAWASLKAVDKVFSDTLYFIYENEDSSQGSLYLGNKLIGGSASGLTPVSVSELSDTLISNPQSKEILIYNGNSWINGNFEDILEYNNKIFEISGTELSLLNFDTAQVGSIVRKDSSGSLTWTDPGTLPEITALQSSIQSLQTNKADITYVEELVQNLNGLKYKKVNAVEDIDLSAEDADRYIYLVRNSNESGSDLYDEYLVIDGVLEEFRTLNANLDNYVTIGQLTSTLSNYITTDTFNSTVNNLNTTLSEHSNAINNLNEFKLKVGDLNELQVSTEGNTLVQQVNEINERLIWKEIVL